jgi:hypothetical protein
MRLPLYYTLPAGRSIESLCDRLAHSPGSIPCDVLPTLHFLAGALWTKKPDVTDYRTCAPVVKEIALAWHFHLTKGDFRTAIGRSAAGNKGSHSLSMHLVLTSGQEGKRGGELGDLALGLTVGWVIAATAAQSAAMSLPKDPRDGNVRQSCVPIPRPEHLSQCARR